MLKGIICGIFIWQAIIFILALIFSSDDDKIIVFSLGVFGIIVLGLQAIVNLYRKIIRSWQDKHSEIVVISRGKTNTYGLYRISKTELSKYRIQPENGLHWLKIVTEECNFPIHCYHYIFKKGTNPITREWLKENCGK